MLFAAYRNKNSFDDAAWSSASMRGGKAGGHKDAILLNRLSIRSLERRKFYFGKKIKISCAAQN